MKRPSFQFYPGDWLKDPELSMCSPATRGVWIDLLCAMHELDQSGELCGTTDQLARVSRCSTADLDLALTDLEATNAADITVRNGQITVICRRMQSVSNERKANAKRQRRFNARSRNANVTQKSRSPSSSSSSSSKERVRTPASSDPPDREKNETKDRLADVPALADFYPRLVRLIRAEHPAVKEPIEGSKDWLAWRNTLEQIHRLDHHSVAEIIDALSWVFQSVHEDARFWRQQVQSASALRSKRPGKLSKSEQIFAKWCRATGQPESGRAHTQTSAEEFVR